MDHKKLRAVCYALAAAVFYAINVPCSKVSVAAVYFLKKT